MQNVREIINTIPSEKKSDYGIYNRLMRKFELDKKMFLTYDSDIKQPISNEELSKDGYERLALGFHALAVKLDDVRFYNTALKVADKVNLTLPEINFAERYE